MNSFKSEAVMILNQSESPRAQRRHLRKRGKTPTAALLAAAEEAAAAWDERQLLLHVYPENESALALYRQAGFEVLRQQSKPFAKTRVLMRKGW